MTDEIKTDEVVTKTEREQNVNAIFNTMYDMVRRFSATTPGDVDNLRRLSMIFYLTIEKIAEHRAKVICGEYIKLIKDDIGSALADIKPKKGKAAQYSDNEAAAETVPDHLKKGE
jgi:hypothetical protein